MKNTLSDIVNIQPEIVGVAPRAKIKWNIVFDFLCGVAAEYALGVLGKNEDDKLYHNIEAYYQDRSISSKTMLKEYFSADPEMADLLSEISFDETNVDSWNELAKKIEWESTEKENSFSFGGFSFRVPKTFLTLCEKGNSPYCLFYSEDNGTAVFSYTQTKKVNIDIKLPAYKFGKEHTSLLSKITDSAPILDREKFFALTYDLKTADEEQKTAISAELDKNVLVIAGAGSGKTRSLVGRLSYLHLVKNISLSRIELLTFTRSATRNMQNAGRKQLTEAYLEYAPDRQASPYVLANTIDGFFKQLVEKNWVDAGFTRKPTFSLDQTQQARRAKCDILAAVIRENRLENVFSEYKIEDFYRNLVNFANGMLVNISGIDTLLTLFIDRQIRDCLILDFVFVACILKRALAQSGSPMYQKICELYDCILIDEFQDINILQNEVLSKFYDSKIHFTFVGDDDQTIYTWRGADNGIIKSMQNDPHVNTIYLTTNYRNNPNIVNAGNDILSTMEDRAKSDREIKAYKTSGSKVRITRYDSHYQNLAHEVKKAYDARNAGEKICILFREMNDKRNFKTNEIVEGEGTKIRRALLAENVPVVMPNPDEEVDIGDAYRVFRALVMVFNKADVKKNLDYLKELTHTGATTTAIKRILLGKSAIPENTIVPAGDFSLAHIAHLAESVDNKRTFAGNFTDVVNNYNTAYAKIVENDSSAERAVKDGALIAFYDYAIEYDWQYPMSKEKLKEIFSMFEEHVLKSKPTKSEQKELPDGVILSTIHKAKGLEYDTVFIVGLNNDEYPNTGKIKAEFERRKSEFVRLNHSKDALDALRTKVDEEMISSLISECDPNHFDEEKADIENMLSEMEAFGEDYISLPANGVEEYQDAYRTYIEPHLRQRDEALQTALKELDVVHETADAKEETFQELDEGTPEYIQAYQEWEEVSKLFEEKEKAVLALELAKKEFLSKVSRMIAFYTITCEAEGYYHDLTRLRDEETILARLEKERQDKEREEKRLFYVAASRASENLYLCIREGSEPSPFVRLIHQDRTEPYLMRTKAQDEEMARLQANIQVIHEEIQKPKVNDKKIDKAMDQVIESTKDLKDELADYVKNYKKEHPQYELLPESAAAYFEKAVSFTALGEKLGHNFGTEIVHNLQRFTELFLQSVIGKKAKPFKTTSAEAKTIATGIRSKMKTACKTEIPGEGYIITLLSQASKFGDELKLCKSLAIECYVICCGKYSVPAFITDSWNVRSFCIPAENFLRAALDLSNIRNVMIHETEKTWATNYLPYAFDCVDTIVEAFDSKKVKEAAIGVRLTEDDNALAEQIHSIIRRYPTKFNDIKTANAILSDMLGVMKLALSHDLCSIGDEGLKMAFEKRLSQNRAKLISKMRADGIRSDDIAEAILNIWEKAIAFDD